MKTCSNCKKTLPASEFHKSRRSKDGVAYRCKTCDSARHRTPEGKDRLRYWAIKKRYGITRSDYEAMALAQGGKCAICLEAPQGEVLDVDHAHATKRVRGLLCGACNTMIAAFHEDLATIQSAIEYLRVIH